MNCRSYHHISSILFFVRGVESPSEFSAQGYKSQFGKVPSSDSASCVAAGVSLAHSLKKYGQSLVGNISQRREEIRMALGILEKVSRL